MKSIAIIGLSGKSIFYNVKKIPTTGETIHTTNIHQEVGGKGYNQAVACKRQGLDVYYLSAIGQDLEGIECEKFMKNEGINSTFIYKNVNTANASIIKDENGNNEVIVYDGANNLLNEEDIIEFKQKIMNVDALLLTYEIPYNALKCAIKIGKELNKLIVLNPAPYVYEDVDILKDVDFITPNETEVMQMFHIKDFDINLILNKCKELNLKNLIITMGANGCLAFINNACIKIGGIKVDALDSTGAGDVFNGCFISHYLKNKNIVEACNYANKMASISVTKNYVLDAIPKCNLFERD